MKDGERIDEALALRRYSMFFPGTRNDLLLEYPELRKVPEIAKLNDRPKWLLFVWYYACKASPVMDLIDDKARIELAVRAAFGDPAPKDIMAQCVSHKWDADVAEALVVMGRFELGVRTRNRLLVERVQKNIQAMLDKDPKWLLLQDIDIQKQYVDMASKAMPMLKGLQETAEGGYGVKETEEKELKPGETMAHLHSRSLEEL